MFRDFIDTMMGLSGSFFDLVIWDAGSTENSLTNGKDRNGMNIPQDIVESR
jgi:hypothetical protein